MRFAMTAMTVAKLEDEGKELNEMTQRNVEKVTQFKEGGRSALKQMVEKMRGLKRGDRSEVLKKRWVYPTHDKEKEELEKSKKKPSLFLV